MTNLYKIISIVVGKLFTITLEDAKGQIIQITGRGPVTIIGDLNFEKEPALFVKNSQP